MISPCICEGQSNDFYPDLFGAYFNNMSLISPAYFPKDCKTDITLSYKSRTGAFSKVSTFAFAVSRVLQYQKKNNQLLRIYFYNQKDGPYISYPRGYFNYGYSMSLFKDVKIAAGFALGFAQTSFSAPTATANGNSTSPDGSIGMSFRYKNNLEIGVASCQIFNSVVSPVVAPITYKRYFNFYANYETILSPFLTLSTYVLWRNTPGVMNDMNISALLNYNKGVFSFGGSYRYDKGLSFFVSTKLNFGTEAILLSFVYNTPFLTKLPGWTDSAEMHGQYSWY
jgi:hypothetical protein